MKNLIIIFGVYLLLLNIVTSYRVFTSQGYSRFQKTFQLLFVWLLPLIGSIVIASLLNSLPDTSSAIAKKHSMISSLLAFLFFIESKKISGYPSNANLYSPDAGSEWHEVNHVDSFSDFGDGGGD